MDTSTSVEISDNRNKSVLTIAGSDPSGGAGIQADLKVFSYLGLNGLSVLTAITAQNTKGVQAVYAVPRQQVRAQLESLADDCMPVCGKTGMLPSVDIIEEVADAGRSGWPGLLVIDPVLNSTGGSYLADKACAASLIKLLVPECCLITPNLPEAVALAGRDIVSAEDAKDAARFLVDAGAGAACITGGHWPGAPNDYLFDGEKMYTLAGTRYNESENLHGTGCHFSAAIVGYIALGEKLPAAVEKAKRLVEKAIRAASSPGAGMKVLSLPPRI